MALVTLLTSALDDFDGGAEGMNFNHLAISERLPGFETQNHLGKIFFQTFSLLRTKLMEIFPFATLRWISQTTVYFKSTAIL